MSIGSRTNLSEPEREILLRKAGRPSFFVGYLRPILFVAFIVCTANSPAQTADNPYYGLRNTWGIFGAYSPRVSGIPTGYPAYHELLDIGVSYNRRLSVSRNVNWQFSAELLPVALESDPLSREVDIQTEPTPGIVLDFTVPASTCAPSSHPYSFTDPTTGTTYAGTALSYCQGRRWTIGAAISPVGMQWDFRPLHKTQPFIVWHGGYMYSTQPIPVLNAGAFNFTVDLGAGVEIFRSRNRSIRAEYRYHHLSNANTAAENPGVESGLFQLTYCFGFGRQ